MTATLPLATLALYAGLAALALCMPRAALVVLSAVAITAAALIWSAW